MSTTFERILTLIREGKIVVSDHGYNELSEDNLFIQDIIDGVEKGIVVEDYPGYSKGPCVLTLIFDSQSHPIHVVWGMPKNNQNIAVLVTAYRPDPEIWEEDYLRRRK